MAAYAHGQVTINDSSLSKKDETCYDANDGAISGLTASGGIGLLTYKWTYTGSGIFDLSKQGSREIFGLSPGNYSLTVTDQSTPPISSSPYLVTIIEKTEEIKIINTSPSIQYLSCFGDSDGTIWIEHAIYPSELQIEWYKNGQLISSLSNQTSINDRDPGTYKVVLKDKDSPTCFIDKIFEIKEPNVIKAEANQVSPVKCKGGNDGKAKLTASGGTPPYTYSWDNSAFSNLDTVNNLTEGVHTVTIKDANGCTNPDPVEVTIFEPQSELAATLTLTPVKCKGGNDGSATVEASGGTPPYTYSWDNSSPSNVAKVINLIAGPHSVTIIDAKDCQISLPFTITEPINPLTASEIPTQNTPVKCNGQSNGTATVEASGGTGNYTFAWYLGITSTLSSSSKLDTATDLKAGTHSVIVTDNNGCSSTPVIIVITQPSVLTAKTQEFKKVTCNGKSDGIATVEASGGTYPYTYLWDNGSTGPVASELAAGYHTVTVKDNNGCEATDRVLITEPAELKVTIIENIPVKCNGKSNGKATIKVEGGTGSYTYIWQNSTSTSASATDLSAGTHNITIKDANGCSIATSVVITEPENLAVKAIQNKSVKCNGESNGSATATAVGGTTPYTYYWDNNSASSATATNLSAGTHTIKVIDGKDCEATTTVDITEPIVLSATAKEDSPVKCKGAFNGAATVTVVGGTEPYRYDWGISSTLTSKTADDLGAGSHTITIYDANDCYTTTEVTITELNVLVLSTQLKAVSCNGGADGSAAVIVTGGKSPYAYFWDGSTSPSIATAINLTAGTHTVKVIDGNGCEAIVSVLITEPTELSATATQVSPVKCKGASNGIATVTPSGGAGLYPTDYTYDWGLSSTSTSATASTLKAGKHNITITDKNGCITSAEVTITEPNALALTENVLPITCGTGGSITVQVTGGVSTNYFYDWTGPASFSRSGANLKSITNLLNGGTYKLTVTDDNGCTIKKEFTLEAYVPLEYTGATAIEFDTCNSNPTYGIATVDIRGGIPYRDGNGNPYYYFEWFGPNNYHSNEAIIPIGPGNYIAIISDSVNCKSSPISFTFTTPYTPIVVNNIIGNVSCDSENADGYIAVSVNGGKIPYKIVWEREIPSTTSGNPNPTYTLIGQDILRVNNLMEGRYRLTVTSNLFSCSDNNPAYKFQTIYTVSTQNSIRILEAPVLDDNLCAGNAGTLKVKVIDDNGGPVSFYYNGVLANAEALGGNYYLVQIANFVTDGVLNTVNEFGCGETVTIDIRVAEPAFEISSVGYNLNGIININEEVTFRNTSTQPYSRLEWNFGDNSDLSEEESPTHTYAVSGIRDVTLRIYNELGCYKEFTEKISVGKGFLAMFPDVFTPNNDGLNDYFQGELIGFASFEFEIYDLWNNKLFSTATDVVSGNTWGWDGNLSDGTAFNGKIFKYVFKGIDNFGKEVIVSNQALLLR